MMKGMPMRTRTLVLLLLPLFLALLGARARPRLVRIIAPDSLVTDFSFQVGVRLSSSADRTAA